MNPLLIGILGYVVVQLAIGVVVSRRIASEDDYLLAGRRMGYGLATFSIFATWFGAETCVDAAGEVYERGLSRTSTEPFAYAVALVLAGVWLAVPLWNKRLTTLADLFRERFSPGVERAAALLLIPTSVFWAAAQVRAFGHVLASASSMSFVASTSIAAGVVIVYTASGGMLADAVTDVVQGTALVLGLVVMLFGVVHDTGGVSASIDALARAQEQAAVLEPASWLTTLESWSAPILGSLVAQELIARMSSARSGRVARRSAIAAGIAYGLVGAIPVLLGLIGSTQLGVVADSEQILPELARRHLSLVGYTLFAGALVSAILSTVDSALLVSSSLLSHNLVGHVFPAASERTKVRVARAGVTGFGLVAFGLSLAFDSVGDLIDVTNGFGSAGVFVLLVFGLFTRFGGPASAFGALIAGSSLYVLGSWLEWPFVYLTALGAATAAYLAAPLGARALSAASRRG